MNTIGAGPAQHANPLVLPAPAATPPVASLENAESKARPVPPVEQSAAPAAVLNRRPAVQDTLESSDAPDIIDALESSEARRVNTVQLGGDQPAPGDEAAASAAEARQLRQQELQEIQVLRQLAARDREVRAHEAAHAAVGGQYAGAPSYTYQRGPDGVNYAVGGEVPIRLPQNAGNPEATLRAAEQVRRAALAPAEPSAADRQIAARATQIAQQARAEIAAQQRAEQNPETTASERPAADEGAEDATAASPARETPLQRRLDVTPARDTGTLLDQRA